MKSGKFHAVARKEKMGYRDERTLVALYAACACLVESIENISFIDKPICNR
jgi:hypothetical protein